MRVDFDQYKIRTKTEHDSKKVYDEVRSKWVTLTPEEEVRQLWIHYLLYSLNISKSKISVEKKITINSKTKRFDLCIYNNKLTPKILIECKAPSIKFSLPNLEQLSIYNLSLKSEIFILTNGIEHLGFKIYNGSIIQLKELSKKEVE